MLKVTFYCFSDILNKGFVNVEYHKSLDNARLRINGRSDNWTKRFSLRNGLSK
jgi:hypothetical protein